MEGHRVFRNSFDPNIMEILNYEEFLVELGRKLDEKYPNVKRVKIENVKLNEKKQGIVICYSNEIAATIYPENLYGAYQGTENMDVVLQIIDWAVKNEQIPAYKQMLCTWEVVKSYVKPFVFNLEKNREYIEKTQCVYQERLDLAYACYIEIIDEETRDTAMMNVSEGMLELWGISEQELFETAEQNAVYEVKPMSVLIKELTKQPMRNELEHEADAMHVISNEYRRRGAAGIFNTELIQKRTEELGCNFYILPSSLHEIILMREDMASEMETLREMVEEVNSTQVLVEDYLSDSIYYYDRETKKVTIVE